MTTSPTPGSRVISESAFARFEIKKKPSAQDAAAGLPADETINILF